MTALLDAMTRGLARGFVALLTVGALVWLADRILGGPRG